MFPRVVKSDGVLNVRSAGNKIIDTHADAYARVCITPITAVCCAAVREEPPAEYWPVRTANTQHMSRFAKKKKRSLALHDRSTVFFFF